jgi:hypothetical protein
VTPQQRPDHQEKRGQHADHDGPHDQERLCQYEARDQQNDRREHQTSTDKDH